MIYCKSTKFSVQENKNSEFSEGSILAKLTCSQINWLGVTTGLTEVVHLPKCTEFRKEIN